jgi:hypothetical protein
LIELLLLYADHHADPFPSMVPEPLISTLLSLFASMKSIAVDVLPASGYWLYGMACSSAPLSIWRLMLLPSVIGPDSYAAEAAGISTVPPPAAIAALIAFWMSVVLFVVPSPLAP